MRRVMRLLAGLLVLCPLAQVPAAAAVAGMAPVVVHPKFMRISGGVLLGEPSYDPISSLIYEAPPVVPLATNGRYVVVWKGSGPKLRRDALRATIIDDRSGGRRLLRYPPGCDPEGLGGPWLLFACRPPRPGVQVPARLYDLAGGTWRSVLPSQAAIAEETRNGCDSSCTLSPSRQSPNDCYVPGGCTLTPLRVGRHWILWSSDFGVPCEYQAEQEHCGESPNFVPQSLDTGQVMKKYVYERVDLDSPRLFRRLCSPLLLPSFYNVAAFADAIFLGPIEIVYGDEDNSGFNRCGRNRNFGPLFDGPIAFNDSVVLGWTSTSGAPPYTLQGRFVPGLRQIAARTPKRLGPTRGFLPPVALTSRHLYLVSYDGSLWRAAAPRATSAEHLR